MVAGVLDETIDSKGVGGAEGDDGWGMRFFCFLTDAYERPDTVEDVSREGWLKPE
ncbi:hypothetical protein CCP4SC76_2790003 [Gammaproteobacteria bacterium]